VSGGAGLHDIVYRLGSSAILALLRLPLLPRLFGWLAKVWLRHGRLFAHLRSYRYDAVVDGGANVGEFAAIVRAAAPAARLLCVEPHPEAAATLRRRGFEVVEAALWRESGRATLVQPEAVTTTSSLVQSADGARASFEVATVRVDELELAGKRILVKLDLQGAELAALEGLERSWDRVAGVLVETGYGPGGNQSSLAELLSARGFREAATFNELDGADGTACEGDKLWLRRLPDVVGDR
jgi:FkbM family methyltransferase